MKISLMLKWTLVIVIAYSIGGCAGCRNELKHMKSGFVGLRRTVTLYNANGEAIKTWSVRAKIEDKGGTVYFLTDDGKAVTVSGTFTVEEQ